MLVVLLLSIINYYYYYYFFVFNFCELVGGWFYVGMKSPLHFELRKTFYNKCVYLTIACMLSKVA